MFDNEGNAPNNLTNKELDRNLWILRHQQQLIKLGKIFLIVFNCLVFGWVLFNLGDNWFGRGVAERQNLETQKENIIPYAELNKILTPEPLAIAEVLMFGGREDKYDLGVEIANSNATMWADFEYKFIGANFETKPIKGFILPKSRKFLLNLGFDSPARPQNARLVFTSFSWHRISRHEYPDFEKYKSERLALSASDVTFGRSALASGALNQVSFIFTNNSAYNFWQIPIVIILFRGDQVVGFNSVTLQKVSSLESRDTSVLWAEGLPQVTRVEVQSEVNILDKNVYMP